MRIGLAIGGTDRFVRPIELALQKYHDCTRFAPRFIRHLPLIGARVNAWLLRIQLQQFIARNDVVLFEWASHLLIRASQLPKRGYIVTRLHAGEITWANRVNWSSVDLVIVLNSFYREQLISETNIFPTKIALVANGVNLERFEKPVHSFRYRLGMVCTVAPRKRVYEAVLALHEMRKTGLPYTLHIAGRYITEPDMNETDLYWPAIRQLVTRLDLSDAVVFYGHVDDISAWLDNVDIFLSNSYWEGQQVALLEAMAAGRYCLSHCWRGVEDVLPNENIYTNESDLVAKISEYALWTDNERLRAQNRMRVLAEDRFDEDRMVKQIAELLESVANTTGSQRIEG